MLEYQYVLLLAHSHNVPDILSEAVSFSSLDDCYLWVLGVFLLEVDLILLIVLQSLLRDDTAFKLATFVFCSFDTIADDSDGNIFKGRLLLDAKDGAVDDAS